VPSSETKSSLSRDSAGPSTSVCRFVGQCTVLPKGFWVGVQYDEPVGKHDGSVKGQRYFQCPDGYGSFLRPQVVKAGDFPPVDDFAFSDGDEI
jgi:tubulin-folding cofactor B